VDQGIEVGPGVNVGPGGITVGPKKKQTCRTVTTTVETPDGRKVTKKERHCDDLIEFSRLPI
jgi:hypothetical protein